MKYDIFIKMFTNCLIVVVPVFKAKKFMTCLLNFFWCYIPVSFSTGLLISLMHMFECPVTVKV